MRMRIEIACAWQPATLASPAGGGGAAGWAGRGLEALKGGRRSDHPEAWPWERLRSSKKPGFKEKPGFLQKPGFLHQNPQELRKNYAKTHLKPQPKPSKNYAKNLSQKPAGFSKPSSQASV